MELLIFIFAALVAIAIFDLLINGETSFIGLLIWLRYRNRPSITGKGSLIGASATVEKPFVQAQTEGKGEASGYVRIDGELWKARSRPGTVSPPVGTNVIVEAVDGLVLTVRPDEDHGAAEVPRSYDHIVS